MTKKQKELIEILRGNYCNVTNAIDEVGITLEDFHTHLMNEDFKKAYDTCQQANDDLARNAMMTLVKAGEKSAVIEYNKQLRQSGDLAEAKMIRKKTMRSLIQLSETKNDVLKEFCDIFKVSKAHADDLFKEAIVEYKLMTPHERQKIKLQKKESSLKERFEKGELTELEMYRGMMADALETSQNSEYPSERTGAQKQVLDIQRRLDEIQEREDRKARMTTASLFERIDSVVFDAPVEEIRALKEKVNKIETTAPAFLEG